MNADSNLSKIEAVTLKLRTAELNLVISRIGTYALNLSKIEANTAK